MTIFIFSPGDRPTDIFRARLAFPNEGSRKLDFNRPDGISRTTRGGFVNFTVRNLRVFRFKTKTTRVYPWVEKWRKETTVVRAAIASDKNTALPARVRNARITGIQSDQAKDLLVGGAILFQFLLFEETRIRADEFDFAGNDCATLRINQ